MVAQNVFHKGSSHQIIDLWRFVDRCNIPWNLPTNFQPDLIVITQRMFLLLLCVTLFQQCHSFRIDEVLKFGDSVIYLHRIWQFPMSCPWMWLSAFPTVRETLVNSFPSLERFQFCTDKIESTEWLNHAPRLRVGDCFEIHNSHWGLCDLLLSSHQTFLLEVPLRQCVFCKKPLSSRFASTLRNFGLLGSEYKNSASWVPLLYDVPIRVMRNVRGRDYLWTPLTILEGLANGRPRLDCYPSFEFVRVFGESRQFPGAGSSLRSDAGLGDVHDESCGGDVEDEPLPEFDDNPGTSRGTKFSILLYMFFSCLVNRGFRPLAHLKVSPCSSQSLPKGRQACHEDLHRHEELKIVDVYLCFLTCLHFSIGRTLRGRLNWRPN